MSRCRRLLPVLLLIGMALVSGCPPPALRIPRGYQRWPWVPALWMHKTDTVSFSRLGTHVAIVSEDGQLSVAVASLPPGQPRVSLADGVAPHFWADVSPWSPDGRALAYVRRGDLIYQRLGGKPRRLTTTGDVVTPAISPDGKRIAFGRMEPTQQQDLGVWAVSVKGGEPRQLVPGTKDVFHATCPHWSPDGKWIAFLQAYEGGALGVVAADGSKIRAGIESAWEPIRWLTDSQTVLFVKTVYGVGGDGIRSYNVGTDSTAEVAARGRNATYALAADGARLLVASWLDRDEGRVTDSRAQIALLATGQREGQPAKLKGAVDRCSWAPDGRQKTLLIRDSAGTGKLWHTPDSLADLKPAGSATALNGWRRVRVGRAWWQFWR